MTGERVRVRRAVPDDEPALAALDRATWDSLSSPAPVPPPGTPFFRERTTPEQVLVAEVDGAVVGYVKTVQTVPLPAHEHVLEVQGLAVDPASRRAGAGRRLLEAAVADARARGARKLALRVLGQNAGARRLYAACGFVVEGVLRGEFVLDGRPVDDVLMARYLDVADEDSAGPAHASPDVEVVVEVPRGSRNKYEWDPACGAVRFDRRLVGAVAFPADYGLVPGTTGSDGEPLDALVLLDEPSFPGVRVSCRVIGVQWIGTRHGPEAKLLCLPLGEPAYEHVVDVDGLPPHVASEIGQFFAVYRQLGGGSTTTDEGVQGRAAALAVLREARERFSPG